MNPPSCKRRYGSPSKHPTGQDEADSDSLPKSSAKMNNVIKQKLTPLYQIGQDWLYLALLGTTMAVLSFSMDQVINLFLNTRLWLFEDLADSNLLARYLAWCAIPLVLVIFSTGFVHLCSPTVSIRLVIIKLNKINCKNYLINSYQLPLIGSRLWNSRNEDNFTWSCA